MTRLRILALSSSLAVLATAAPGALAATDAIGTAGAVNPASTQTPPGGTTRVVEIGSRVVHRERIVTSANGSVQLLFIDKTSLNIGPNSSIVIDEFVYDPNTANGRMAVTVVQGVMRFIGGNASHTGGATIQMPSVTLGVRGGVVQAESRNGRDLGVLLFGRAEFSSGNQTQVVRRPGWGILVSGPGQMSAPQKFNIAQLQQINAQVIPANSRGGASQRPTQERAQQALGPGNAGTPPPLIVAQQTQTVGERIGRDTPQHLSAGDQQGLNETIQTSVQDQGARERAEDPRTPIADPRPPVIDPRPPVNPDPPVTPPPPDGGGRPVSTAFALNVTPDGNLGSGAPYLPAGFVAAGTFRNSQLLGYAPRNGSDGAARNPQALQAGLAISGSGAQQTSAVYLMTTTFLRDSSGAAVSSGGFRASSRTGATQAPVYARGFVSSAAGATSVDGNQVPTGATFTQNEIDPNGQLVSRLAQYQPPGGGQEVTYGFSSRANSASAPTLASRDGTALVGFSAGIARTVNERGADVEPSYAIQGASTAFAYAYDATIEDDARLSAFISAARTDGGGQGTSMQTAVLAFGYQGDTLDAAPRSAFIDADRFGARDSGLPNGTPSQLTTVNGAPVSSHNGLFVTSRLVDAESFFPNVQFCRCEYTKWGFWSSETRRDAGGQAVADRVHLGTWAAGRLTDVVQMPTTGSATFSGHAIGSFKSGNAEYLAAGNLTANIDFGRGSGTLGITGLDGRNYSGALLVPQGSVAFFGTDIRSSAGPATTMTTTGFFYDGRLGPASEIAGQFNVTGSGYIGAGIIAGAR